MYILNFTRDDMEQGTRLELRGDGNTEQILRGLLHEGYTITIREEREKKRNHRDDMQSINSMVPAEAVGMEGSIQ